QIGTESDFKKFTENLKIASAILNLKKLIDQDNVYLYYFNLCIEACKTKDTIVFRASKLLSMKTKLRKLIQCLVANIRDIDVSLIQKKKDKSQLEWNKISATLRESVKEAAAKRFFEDNMVKFRREGSSSSSFQQFMENLASWRAACDEKKWLVNYENEDQVLTEVLTNDDVLGDLVTLDEQEKMRQFCYHSLKLGTGAKEIAQFPGSRPVSLNRENLQLLRQRYYYATWKAGGTRYMMLITSDGCFLIDINFNFRRVQMRFPLKQTNKYLGEDTHNLTLLDGEMVIEASPQKKERRYLIYDLMAINSVSIIERPFSERWKMLEKEVIEPRNLERQSRKFNFRYDLEPFKVKRKEFWLLSATTKLLKVIPMLPHEAHGLIFRGWDDPCVPRTHEGILEWKYPDTNSVDFLFEVDENRQLLYLNELGKKKLMDGNHVDFKNGEVPSELSGRIIECSWNSVEQAWNCMRVSVDKSFPSDINTYMKVMRSIKDNITEEVLLEVIGDIVLLPMYADRMRNDSKARSKQHS
ncbi:hypothetical protein MKW94_027471, partial [Papaver nudicaule]|nr:hypothetical protein [Papaver nudicaule]